MRAWLIRNVRSFLSGLASTPGGRRALEDALDNGCAFCMRPMGPMLDAGDVESIDEKLGVAHDVLAGHFSGVPTTRYVQARDAVMAARRICYRALNPRADVADEHEALS